MASGIITGTTNNNYIDSRIVWESTPTDTERNTSWVTASLQYRRTNTGFTTKGTGTFALNIDGKRREVSTSITIQEEWVTAITAQREIDHNDDGTKSINLNSYGYISGTSLESTKCMGTITLDTIDRASTINSIQDVILGDTEYGHIRWKPKDFSFRYKIKFSLGSWSNTTGVHHPKQLYEYTALYRIPLDVANQLPNNRYGTMTATLYTYSDEAATIQIGESSSTFKVTVPDNEMTRPTFAMSLSPINMSKAEFNGLYIQNKTLVRANFTGDEAKYSASISSHSMSVDGKTYRNEPYQSNLVSQYGSVPVTGTVKDSRGISSSITQNITVIPYSKPSLVPFTGESSIICKRCDSTGNLMPSGTCLRIRAGMQYSKVVADGVQKNFCIMSLKYREEGSTSWKSEVTILAKDATADSVDAILTNVNLSPAITYIVQIEVADDVGESYSTLITIPTDNVTVHLREGGKAVGIGKYAETDNIVDIDDEWKVNVRGTLRANNIDAIDLYDGKDFNELTNKTGYYNSPSAPETVGCSNYPINLSGVLEVISGYGFAFQTYRTYNGSIYTRSYFANSGWVEWKQVTLT